MKERKNSYQVELRAGSRGGAMREEKVEDKGEEKGKDEKEQEGAEEENSAF
jgi:hypothetical protein